MSRVVHVTVWGENIAERSDPAVKAHYPDGMHEAIASGLRESHGDRVSVRTAALDQPEHGLDAQVLSTTDVLVWWGHLGHKLVADEVAANVQARVLQGMGLVVLHSGHLSKPFTRLMGTSCMLRWREDDDREVVWTVSPSHPIVENVPHVFVIPQHEMYGEFFDIPTPDELVFISSFEGGEVFRSGCCFYRGKGRVFYFSPGHETYPVYHQREIRQVLANAVLWAYVERPSTVDTVSPLAMPRGWFEQINEQTNGDAIEEQTSDVDPSHG